MESFGKFCYHFSCCQLINCFICPELLISLMTLAAELRRRYNLTKLRTFSPCLTHVRQSGWAAYRTKGTPSEFVCTCRPFSKAGHFHSVFAFYVNNWSLTISLLQILSLCEATPSALHVHTALRLTTVHVLEEERRVPGRSGREKWTRIK